MSITETMALTLLVTGSLSLYLILHAAIDLYHNGLPPPNTLARRKP